MVEFVIRVNQQRMTYIPVIVKNRLRLNYGFPKSLSLYDLVGGTGACNFFTRSSKIFRISSMALPCSGS